MAISSTYEHDEQGGGQRGRPSRRSLQNRQGAFLGLLQGKATIDQIAPRLGVRPENVAGWRDAALAGIDAALLRVDGPTARERVLEQQHDTLRDALTRSVMQVELRQRELGIPTQGPTPRRRSRR